MTHKIYMSKPRKLNDLNQDEIDEAELHKLEYNYPGITSKECSDPYKNYNPHSEKCRNCPRNGWCQLNEEEENDLVNNILTDLKQRFNPKNRIPKHKKLITKRKTCRCKK